MKALKKAFIFVLVLALAMSCMAVVFAQDNSSAVTSQSSQYYHKYAHYGSNNYTQRPTGEIVKHTIYVGGPNGSDNNKGDNNSKETPYATLWNAILDARNAGWLGFLNYETATVIHEVDIVILDDIILKEGYLPQIWGGILTIKADTDVTISVGPENSTVKSNYVFYLCPEKVNNKGNSYIELNLGTPDMKGSITFDCTNLNLQKEAADSPWSGFVVSGRKNQTANNAPDMSCTVNMYDGITIKNIGYNETTGEITASDIPGPVINVTYGTFNMFGGTITQNACRAIVEAINTIGGAAYIYGGTITNNRAMAFKTTSSTNAKIVIYDVLLKNNWVDKTENTYDWSIFENYNGDGTMIVYGGTFINNYSKSNGALIESSKNFYIDESNVTIKNEAFEGLGGEPCGVIESIYTEKTNKTDMNSILFYAKDGSVLAYGYTSDGTLLKDGVVGYASFDDEIVSIEDDEYLYTKKDTTDCTYLVKGDKVDISFDDENPISKIYYFGDTPSHQKGNLTRIVYNDGFDALGEKHYECAVCQNVFIGDTADIIFTAKGYSVAEENKDEIMGGYTVDLDALDLYEKTNPTKLSYGIIFVNVSDVSSISFEGGKITSEKAIQAENLDRMFSQFNFKIGGFNKDAEKYDKLKALPLVIAMYVLENDNVSFVQKETSLAYVGDGIDIDGSEKKLKALTLEQILKNASDDGKVLSKD